MFSPCYPGGTGDSWSAPGWGSVTIPVAIPVTILAAVKEPLPAGLKNRHGQKLEPRKTFTIQIAPLSQCPAGGIT